MKDAGFFKILQPKQFGGFELDPHTFSEVQLRVAQGCMSTAWVLGVIGIHPFQLALYDDKAQKKFWERMTTHWYHLHMLHWVK